jgi:hypothetical protein
MSYKKWEFASLIEGAVAGNSNLEHRAGAQTHTLKDEMRLTNLRWHTSMFVSAYNLLTPI